jgi:hypothetical protein
MNIAVVRRRHFGRIWIAVWAALTLVTWGVDVHAQIAPAVARGPLCFDPAEWDGRYPAKPGAGAPRFIDLPCVREPLKALLPPPELRRFLETTTVDSPIRLSGRYLIVARCMAHACPAHHAMVIIDTERGDFVVGLYRRSSKGSVTSWYSNGRDPLELPPEITEQFLRKHTPAP